MTLQEAKRHAVSLANETGKIWSVVARGECGLLGNNKDCEVVPFPARGRFNMGNYGPGALL